MADFRHLSFHLTVAVSVFNLSGNTTFISSLSLQTIALVVWHLSTSTLSDYYCIIPSREISEFKANTVIKTNVKCLCGNRNHFHRNLTAIFQWNHSQIYLEYTLQADFLRSSFGGCWWLVMGRFLVKQMLKAPVKYVCKVSVWLSCPRPDPTPRAKNQRPLLSPLFPLSCLLLLELAVVVSLEHQVYVAPLNLYK